MEIILRIIWYFLPFFVALNYIFAKRVKKEKIYNKNVLIVGGGSGLGYSLALKLSTKFNEVTLTSRDQDLINEINATTNMKIFFCDVFDDSTFDTEQTNYDIIFYCTGIAIPGTLSKTSIRSFSICEGTNYLGMIKILKNYIKINTTPFDFVMIGSTLATFQVEGYAAYSPTKSAMLSFFYSTYDELKSMGVRLHFFSPSNMQTRGFDIENKTKPEYTKTIESFFSVNDPDKCAEYVIKKFKDRKIITIDWFTYFCHIRFECEKFIDYLWFPVAVVVVFISKILSKLFYKIYDD